MAILKICNHLKYYRERRAISQQKLAEMAGVNKMTISRIERTRTRVPCHATRQKLSAALQVSVHRIFVPVRFRHSRNAE